MKTPQEIAAEIAPNFPGLNDPFMAVFQGWIAAGIEADRAQRQPEIYIVQNDVGEVVDVFRDAGEATAAYQEGYSVVEETIWEPGEWYSMADQTREEGEQ